MCDVLPAGWRCTATQNVLRRSFYARRVATRFTNMTKDVLIFHTLAKFCLALFNSHSQAKVFISTQFTRIL